MTSKPFLRTPSPQPHESLMGYVLRLTEANRYASPWRVLSVAGHTQGEMFKPTLDPVRLAERLGKPGAALRAMAMCRTEADGRRVYRIGSQELGRSLTHSPYRLRRPAICPACISEQGFARQSWDLAAVAACSRHGQELLGTCTDCGRHLTWFRSRLLQCKCGADLTQQPQVAASQALVEFTALLERRIDGDRLSTESSTGLPIFALEALPFDVLIKLVHTLYRLRPQAWKSLDSPGRTAAKIFADWPQGFQQYLRDTAGGTEQRPATVGLRRRFETLYGALFKRRLLSKHLGFMRQAFVDFGLTQWGQAIVDGKFKGSAGRERRFVSATEFARRVGVQPITVRRWVDRGRVSGSVTQSRDARGFVVDAAGVDGIARLKSERMQARAAGKYIGLPVSVLRQLKASAHYSTNPAANASRGFWKSDLDSLSQRLIDCSTASGESATTKPRRSECVALGDVLGKLKFGDEGAKGRLVASLLDGNTLAVGKAPKRLHQLRLSVADVERFRVRDSLARPTAVISRQAAAAMLNVGVYAIPALVEAGLLKKPRGTTFGLDRESVLRFRQDWRLMSDLARELRTSSSRLNAAARQQRLKVRELSVRPGYGLGVISRAGVECLVSALGI